jgi:periplasmic protein TonB
MEATREIVTSPRRPETWWWSICIALALGIHAAAAAALLAQWNAQPNQVANAPLILVELEPLTVAPETKPAEQPPGPQQQQAAGAPARLQPVKKTAEAPPQQTEAPPQPVPQKPAELTAALAPEPKAELQIAATPPPQPLERPQEKSVEKPIEKQVEKLVEKKHRQKQASLASAPNSAEHRAERAAAPAPGASARNLDAVPNWKSQLVARLEHYKRVPPEAPNATGIATLAFSVDRGGGVHNARIVRSSGIGAIDRETLTLVERAAPMPSPPPEVAGAQIAISVPIRYNMR